jgi:tRNA G10  N-methylase Trm11
MDIKKVIRKSGRPVRIVPNKTPALSSAQVLHNKLTHKGAWELLFVKKGNRTYLAQTLFVQDIEAYAGRDQARPARDAKAGMLPPKLAQIIINLAAGQIGQKSSPDKIRLLDPFCGSGVILQEALLAGMSVLGSDINPRAIEAAQTNLKWLYKAYPHLAGHVSLECADATTHTWPRFSAVASEIDLGPPLSGLPDKPKIDEIKNKANKLLSDFLKNLARQTPKGLPVCLAVPAWDLGGGEFLKLPVIDHLTDIGYTIWDLKTAKNGNLVYHRPGQIVGRQLIRIKRI